MPAAAGSTAGELSGRRSGHRRRVAAAGIRRLCPADEPAEDLRDDPGYSAGLGPVPDAPTRTWSSDWRRELSRLAGFNVGIAWQGNPRYRRDRQRSFRLAQLEPLARIAGVRLFSLKRALGLEQIGEVDGRFAVTDLGSRLSDFMDTAAVMQILDLVITPDTSLAHLAGALGVPVWVAISFAPDWRWLIDRADSPWYPTMRLFRQKTWGEWDEVFERMATMLRKMVEENQADPRAPPPS